MEVSPPADEIIGAEQGIFESKFNRNSFPFSHSLHLHPLCSLDSIIDLARRRAGMPALVYWSNGKVGVGDSWAAGTVHKASLEDTLAQIATNDSLVMLRRLEQDVTFGPLIKQLMQTLIDRVGPRMRDDVIIGRGTFLIASPHRITSYHIDGDTNFLFQIRGAKWLDIFDNTDRSLLTDRQLEQYFCGDVSAAAFRPDRRQDGLRYRLGGGSGVHIPSTAPHWAQNLDDVSIALSINFDLRSVERRAKIFRVNRRLRRLGLSPSPPDQSAWRDEFKLAASNLVRALKKTMRRGVIEEPALR